MSKTGEQKKTRLFDGGFYTPVQRYIVFSSKIRWVDCSGDKYEYITYMCALVTRNINIT